MKKSNLIILICFIPFIAMSQMEDYQYKRSLKGIQEGEDWYNITLTNEIFAQTKRDLSDLRVLGITNQNDTIEAPYILQVTRPKQVVNEVRHDVINQVSRGRDNYFTLEVGNESVVNMIELDFLQKNFDWKLDLEGRNHPDSVWYTIKTNYRIVGISNALTDYQFTKIKFGDSRFRFYRIKINARKRPVLRSATTRQEVVLDGESTAGEVFMKKVLHNTDEKKSTIEITLSETSPVSYLDILVNNQYDYYRPITVAHVKDSFKTESGWNYRYENLYSGTLSSLESDQIYFSERITGKLKITIDNYDNEPLDYGQVNVGGPIYSLTTRLSKPANYFLVYGNKRSTPPIYDIVNFQDKIPTDLLSLKLDPELDISDSTLATVKEPFFNKYWMWAIMVVIIAVLGGFSLKMIKSA